VTAELQTPLGILPTRCRRKPAGIDRPVERNYVTVAACIYGTETNWLGCAGRDATSDFGCFADENRSVRVDNDDDDEQRRRQVKLCGVDRHGERRARAYNGGLEQRWTWVVGSIHGLGWVGLNEKYCGTVAEYRYCKTHILFIALNFHI